MTTNKELLRFSRLVNEGVPPQHAARQMGKTSSWATYYFRKLGLATCPTTVKHVGGRRYHKFDDLEASQALAIARLRQTMKAVRLPPDKLAILQRCVME